MKNRRIIDRLLIILLFVTFGSKNQSVFALDLEAKKTERALVFDRWQEGSKFYRIPAIVTATDGALVAVADKRIDSNKDLPGRIDVVCRRSTDGGLTWTPMQTVAANDSTGGYGDPALVVDRSSGDILCIMTHGQGLMESSNGDHARICVSRSHDNGATWSATTDITDQIFGAIGSGAPVEGIGLFASSGRALQLRDGRLMFVLVVRPTEKKWSALTNYAVYSDDGGHNWTINPTPITVEGDEAKVVELADGRLICSVRARKGKDHQFTYSDDRGETWYGLEARADIVEPACNGDIIAINRDGREILLQSIPYNKEYRENVSILASEDGGQSWEPLVTVCPVWSSYSSMTEMPDGSLGVLTEEGCSEGGFRLWFTKIELR